MPGLDPFSIGLSGLSTLFGIGESIAGHHKEKQAEQDIANLPSPTYTPNKGVMDYYNTALQRYNTNPYQSQQYQQGIQQGNRNTAAGLNALQDRQSAIGGISRLVALQNNNALQQGAAAENTQNQRFSQLGSAAQGAANEGRYGFQINQLMPYQQKLQLLGMKAGAGANQYNAGLQTIFGGLNNAAMIGSDQFMNKIPKVNNGLSSNSLDLNSLNGGGLGGNYDALQGGNPFANDYSSYQNPYGE
jgi:hypothetical protein